jgi:DNA topoisomerase-6 subunit B
MEILPHPSDMDLQTLKKAISKSAGQKITLSKILCTSFQKLSYEKAKEIISLAQLDSNLKNSATELSEHDLIKIVNICKKTKFQNPNTDHLSPIGQEILTIGMMSEYTIVSSKNIVEPLPSINNNDNNIANSQSKKIDNETDNENIKDNNNNTTSKSNFSVKILQPVLTAYTSRIGIINNRPTIIETGLAYGGDISSFKLYRFANKIPLLYDEGSDVAREVVSEVEINKMGITKKQAKEQFSTNKDSKRERIIEVLPIHIFFHICSTKIPYKTAGKESIASEGELKSYMKSCLSELYRKLSIQIRKELKIKEAENKMKLYKHYLPFIVEAITESLGIKNSKLNESFSLLIERHLTKKSNVNDVEEDNIVKHDKPSESKPNLSSLSQQDPKTEKKEKSNILSKSPKNNNNNNRQIDVPKTTTNANQDIHKSKFSKTFSDLNNKKKERSNTIHKKNIGLKKYPKNNNNNNSSEKKLENIPTKQLMINKIDDKQKIRSTDIQPTLDSYQNQRRVNKGKIR